jgi:hypothetical protein
MSTHRPLPARRPSSTLILTALLAVNIATPAWAWGRLGHRLTARLAERHLNSKAGFFAYPPEKVYSRHYPVVTDGAEGVSAR